jgi:Fe-S cluster assembly protein SufD
VATETATLANLSREAVERLAAANAEPAWLREWRLAAWAAYEALPMPSRQDEDWRRTDIRGLPLGQLRAPNGLVLTGPTNPRLAPGLEVAAELEADLGGVLALSDGAPVYQQLVDAAPGLILTDLATAVREHEPLVQAHLGSVVPAAAGKFPALNAALWQGGTFVYVPRNTAVALPILSTLWQQAPSLAFQPRTLVVLERGASLTLVHDLRSADQPDPACYNGVVELVLGEGALLRYASLQRWGAHTWHFSTERARLGRDARLEWVVVGLGGRLTKSYVEAELAAPGASARLLGIVFGADAQHFDYHTRQDHVAPRATSDLLFKTVLADTARSVFVGLINVRKAAQQTDAYLANRNLLLAPTARADSIPRLEIEANDVRCTHGATVAPVDPEQVFYLQTRGLSPDEAETLIVHGFFEPVLEEIPAASVRDRVRAALAQKMARSRAALAASSRHGEAGGS